MIMKHFDYIVFLSSVYQLYGLVIDILYCQNYLLGNHIYESWSTLFIWV